MMNNTHNSRSPKIWSPRYTRLLLAVWTIIFAGLLAWNIRATRQTTRNLALNEARVHLERDLTFRLWATSHGGVYVPSDERTPPNPYLFHVPEQNIETPSGQRLTLMNPAYALRQMNEDFQALYGVYGHITSLDPLRPENGPDAWERAALQTFEQGESEALAWTELDGAPHLRLMQPMMTTEGCLKCHAHQGYHVGDVRGGVSISVPMADYQSQERREIATSALSLGLLWMLGFVGINLGSRGLEQRIRERDQTRAEIERIRQREDVLNAILRISIQDISLKEQLERTLDTILAIPWLPVTRQGAIFLTGDDPDVLELDVHRGLPPQLLTACNRVPFGKCFCGRAAASGEIEFADRVDERHETRYEGMPPHGHYCVPILSGGETVGIMTFYLEPGHQWDAREADFLQTDVFLNAVARALSGIIERQRAREALCKYKYIVSATSDHMSFIDRDYVYRTVNEAYLQAHAKTRVEIIGHSVPTLLGPDIFEQLVKENLDRCLGGAEIHYQSWFEFPGIGPRYMDVAYYPFFKADGVASGVVVSSRDITALKQAEEELSHHREHLEELVEARTAELAKTNASLRESKEFFKSLVASISDAVTLTDLDGHILFVNDAATQMFGWGQDELVGRSAFSLIAEESLPAAIEGMEIALRKGVARNRQYNALKADGNALVTATTATLIRDADGNPYRFVAVTRDITERAQAEKTLLRLESAVNQSMDGIAVTNLDGRIEFVNPAWAQNHGYSVEESLGQHFGIFHTREQMQADVNPFTERVLEMGTYQGEVAHVRKDGSVFPTWMTTTLLKDKEGNPVGMVGIFRDITERKRAREALQESESKLDGILSAMDDYVFTFDAEGRFTFVRTSSNETLYAPSDTFIGKKPRDVMPSSVNALFVEAFEKTKIGQVAEYDYDLETNAGDEWFSAKLSPLLVADEFAGAVAVVRNISARKRMQAQIEKYAGHLEQLVEEKVRELDLERAKTVQTAKLAALGEMATGVAHELNQPLTAMLFEAEYLKTLGQQQRNQDFAVSEATKPGFLSDELHQMGQNLESDINRCRRIINHLRDFGRTSSEGQATSVNLNKPIEDSFILVGMRLREHGVELNLQLAPDLPLILADPHKLEQVFLNLISNAEYAMEERERKEAEDRRIGGDEGTREERYHKVLEISTHHTPTPTGGAGGGEIVATVRDNGCGIPANVRERIFEPFFSTKPVGEGTGLGLSISYGIVTEFGGEISFESAEGAGTTFTLRFPAASEHRPRSLRLP